MTEAREGKRHGLSYFLTSVTKGLPATVTQQGEGIPDWREREHFAIVNVFNLSPPGHQAGIIIRPLLGITLMLACHERDRVGSSTFAETSLLFLRLRRHKKRNRRIHRAGDKICPVDSWRRPGLP